MACETKTWLVLHLLLLVACYMQHCVQGSSEVPCLFIFGDSFSDNGNNNDLPTIAKANYNPYGVDFQEGPTGRVTNGATEIDIIGQLLGFGNFIPPFANTTGSDILKGVNYASSSAGIRNETGKLTAGTNIALGLQIENHKTIVAQIANKLGGVQQAAQYLNKCLFYVYIGTNDYLLNYFQPEFYNTSETYNPEEYAQVLIDELSIYLHALYDVGSKKFVLHGLGKIGCYPIIRANSANNGSCVEDSNDVEAIFSEKLKSLVDQSNTLYLDSKSIFINISAVGVDISLGFTVFSSSCCPMKSDGFCIRDSIPCTNRNEYVFYDGIHPTSAANNIIASNAYDSTSNPEITYPMDIKRLAQLVI